MANRFNIEPVVFLSDLLKGAPGNYIQDQAALCFGDFFSIHPGHIRYFHKARLQGERLHVAIQGDALIANSQSSASFTETERAEALADLNIVDQVIILDVGKLQDLVTLYPPKMLILGKEFENHRLEQVTGAISQIGNKVLYDDGATYQTASDLLHHSESHVSRHRLEKFRNILRTQDINLSKVLQSTVNKAPTIVVIGDTILDEYMACDPVGMSAEAPVLVVRELEAFRYLGGAAIVAAHLQALGGQCRFFSVIGEDANGEWLSNELRKRGVEARLFEAPERSTTLKIRYMVQNQKIFRVSRLSDQAIPKYLEEKIISGIEDMRGEIDGIVISDFVYGVVTPRILDYVRSIAKTEDILIFGDVQSSSQIGNVSKLSDFSVLCPTEREARLAVDDNNSGLEQIAVRLLEKTATKNLVLKLGPEGFVVYAESGDGKSISRQHFPALVVNPVDVVGAGDSLLSTLALTMSSGCSLVEGAALANCVVKLVVNTMGNQPISYHDLSIELERLNLSLNTGADKD